MNDSTNPFSRILSGILIPQARNQPIEAVRGPVGELMKRAEIETFTRVQGAHSWDHNFVGLVEDDGIDRHYLINSRAVLITGYPGPLLGNCLLFSEGWVDDGMDLMDIDPAVMPWIEGNLARLIDEFLSRTSG